MSLAILRSRAQIGVAAPAVTIEVLLSGGLPSFSVVGLAEAAVRESKDRVRGAILSCGFDFPQQRITVSLGPADMKKSGGRFDLAIALGILLAGRQLRAGGLEDQEFYGELGLNGEIRPVPGVLPAAIKCAAEGRAIWVPAANAREALLPGATVFAASGLLEVAAHLNRERRIEPAAGSPAQGAVPDAPDLAEVRGQAEARRALEIAASGGHNLLLAGPPGTGKSMLARRLPGLLPPMSDAEALETAAVNSVLGLPFDAARWRQRPFRAPHHSASAAALVGGGSDPRPGEISRAHNGVLFLDELPEWSRHVLEMLREPLEAGRITISRAGRQVDFPARFQFVAAMNPCPCGYHGDERGHCHCSADRIQNYRGKISGPLLDRIDLHVAMRRACSATLRGPRREESTACVAARVAAARERQLGRSGRLNAELNGNELESACRPTDQALRLLDRALDQYLMSMRAQRRVLRVARTIADLAGAQVVGMEQIGEALALRGFGGAPG
ncbi:MAG: YifB family Mg chelatase-like AAA ATPase [Gammaproteobacteria bacterium]|nr:YifB family Mg chelatase-like AAA ATPase [Gammaproteobacteria bacterium]MDH4253717.1 YifB family Mg chelatase-like AAA ATPase [Gammaproteobacteria bacterium]MDH5309646.1 YifB family Mg chelatase-like AAA ATPase [Gammaproteobacteria bacterium]